MAITVTTSQKFAEETDLHRYQLAAKDRAEMIEATGAFSELPWRVIETLSKYFLPYSIVKGGLIFSQGAKDAYICIIGTGSVKVMKQSSKGRYKTLAVLGPGKLLGEMSLLDGEPRSAAAVASESGILLVLTISDFERLSKDAPNIALRFALMICKQVGQRLRQTSGVLVEHLGETE